MFKDPPTNYITYAVNIGNHQISRISNINNFDIKLMFKKEKYLCDIFSFIITFYLNRNIQIWKGVLVPRKQKNKTKNLKNV